MASYDSVLFVESSLGDLFIFLPSLKSSLVHHFLFLNVGLVIFIIHIIHKLLLLDRLLLLAQLFLFQNWGGLSEIFSNDYTSVSFPEHNDIDFWL